MIFYGRNIVIEALKSNYSSSTVYIQTDINESEKISELIELAKGQNVPIKNISRQELSRLTKSDEHQGVAIETDFHESKLQVDAIADNDAYIYISEVTFEHNVGAIIRSAECSGFKGVILPKKVEITPTIAKTSAGALFHIPIHKESIFNAIKKFKDSSYSVFGIEVDGESYFNVDLTGPSLFIIGGEDKSLSTPVRDKSDAILEIPLEGKVNSLNMSVAASIVMYERLRQLSN